VLLPGLLAMFMLIRATSEGPGLFWSYRVGHHGRIFRMPKFRTMYDGTELMQREKMSAQVEAITPLGQWLRRWSLDELPQLWSIMIGDMAFIGPRPLIPDDEAQAQRNTLGLDPSIRPGLTGLAQINGRNSVSPRAKARYDVFYARHVNPWLDVMILRRTIRLVLRGTGIW
jgi:O-antigen biosynthesis protein WbqP